jgi:hypothetical protein
MFHDPRRRPLLRCAGSGCVDACLLSFDEVVRRAAARGTHTAAFAESEALVIARSYREALYQMDEPPVTVADTPIDEFAETVRCGGRCSPDWIQHAREWLARRRDPLGRAPSVTDILWRARRVEPTIRGRVAAPAEESLKVTTAAHEMLILGRKAGPS